MRHAIRGLALAAAFLLGSAAEAAEATPALWQERFFWDALMTARDRLARTQSDPALLAVMKSIASQGQQQVANMEQITTYMKTQKDNLNYAFDQEDPAASLETIGANFETLAQGSRQIRQNLYYLTARCRIASSQALPDPEYYQASLQVIAQVQQAQLKLNELYLEAKAVHDLVAANAWGTDKFFRHKSQELLRSVMRIQDAVFKVYNSAYELSVRSR